MQHTHNNNMLEDLWTKATARVLDAVHTQIHEAVVPHAEILARQVLEDATIGGMMHAWRRRRHAE